MIDNDYGCNAQSLMAVFQLKCAGSSVKESVQGMVSRLYTNNVLCFLSMSGRNLGKIAFADTSMSTVVVGMYCNRGDKLTEMVGMVV